MSDIILPEPSADQAYFDISALHCGTLTGFESTYISPHADPKSKKAMPSLVFLLFHSQRKSFHLFDLGLRKDWKSLPPYAQQQITEMFEPCTADNDAHELLEAHDIEPGKIETIFLSHVHWDHIGDQTNFRSAKFVLLDGSKAIIENGYPYDKARSTPQNAVPLSSRSEFLSTCTSEWKPIGSFQRGYDYFGDGSLYLIDAPGHIPGHMNLLIRANGRSKWVFLAGDTVHDRRILHGEKGIAVAPVCAHVHVDEAMDHLKRVKRLMDDSRVQVILSHDAEWYELNKDSSNHYPISVNGSRDPRRPDLQ